MNRALGFSVAALAAWLAELQFGLLALPIGALAIGAMWKWRVDPPAGLIGVAATAMVIAGSIAGPRTAAPLVPAAPSGPGVVYAEAQMEQALAAVRVPEPSAHVGAAIGMAESGGRSDAIHLCPPRCDPGQAPEQSYGPWQLNVLAHRWVAPACAMSLGCAAQAVAAISGHGSNWTPWTTYVNGAWRRYA